MDTGQRRPSRLDPADGIYVKVKGRWTYLYRAVDSRGQTIDFLLSAKRDAAAARALTTAATVVPPRPGRRAARVFAAAREVGEHALAGCVAKIRGERVRAATRFGPARITRPSGTGRR